MRFDRRHLAPVTVFLSAIAAGGWLLQESEPAAGSFYAQSRVFDQVRQIVARQFVDSVTEADLYHNAADGIVKGLGDPHSSLFNPHRLAAFNIDVNGQYGGVGLRVGKSANQLTVTTVIPHTPAERAGIHAGDRILQIDQTSTRAWGVDSAASHLRGQQGTPVTLVVGRPGQQGTMQLKLVREAVRVSAVPAAYMMQNGIGYISLEAVSDGSSKEVADALRELKTQGMRALILDLRGNGGGYLQEAVGISELFLDPERLVVETRGRQGADNQKYLSSNHNTEFLNLPITVLVDPYTASAAEIVAGALQDHDRAMLIGQRTFGKGVAQLVFPLNGGFALKLTTERWYTPSGRSIQKLPPKTSEDDDAPVSTLVVAGQDSVYHSFEGRRLAGGGGIVPDIVLPARDSATVAQRLLDQKLTKVPGKFGETMFEFAVAYHARHPELKPGFAVTPVLLGEFYDALQQAGLKVDRRTYDDASELTAKRLALQITFVAFGEQEARRRGNVGDHQVDLAVDLLSRAQNTRQLLRLTATAHEPHG
jgi:carboxyl-terminal processing protease